MAERRADMTLQDVWQKYRRRFVLSWTSVLLLTVAIYFVFEKSTFASWLKWLLVSPLVASSTILSLSVSIPLYADWWNDRLPTKTWLQLQGISLIFVALLFAVLILIIRLLNAAI